MKNLNPEELLPGGTQYVQHVTGSLCLEFPMREDFLAQLIVPRNITTAEAQRLCRFIETLALPDRDVPDEAKVNNG